jgi:FdhD protein
MKDVVVEINAIRVNGDEREIKQETIAAETEMRLIVNDKPLVDFLYSGGWDEQLVIGYLISSGLILNLQDIESMELEKGVGKVWISEIKEQVPPIQDVGLTISHRQLIGIRAVLLDNQKYHKNTRGFHGAILWELSTGKWFMCEDIGRHNTVDKVIGYGIQNGYAFSQSLILLSGRLVSDIVLKCKLSRIPLIASMTIATDGGIELARDSNMTIIGALSEDGFWLYNEGAVKIT